MNQPNTQKENTPPESKGEDTHKEDIEELRQQKFYQFLRVAGFHKEAEEYLTSYGNKCREEERERIREWVKRNYSRSAEPIYAHVDLKDLYDVLTPPLTNNQEHHDTQRRYRGV